jgi:hypothetical protein
MQALRRLRQFARGGHGGHGCEMCGQPLDERHFHRYRPSGRIIRCCCQLCALIPEEGWLEVPRRRQAVSARLDQACWTALGIPVGLASFVRGQYWSVAYPGPAGLVESALSDEAVADLLSLNPDWAQLQAHVEAIVVNRLGEPVRALLLPIDEHFRLSGLLRSQWRGMSGGQEVWQTLEQFFDA